MGCMTPLSVKVRKQATFLSQVTLMRGIPLMVSGLQALRSTRIKGVVQWQRLEKYPSQEELNRVPVCPGLRTELAGDFLPQKSYLSP